MLAEEVTNQYDSLVASVAKCNNHTNSINLYSLSSLDNHHLYHGNIRQIFLAILKKEREEHITVLAMLKKEKRITPEFWDNIKDVRGIMEEDLEAPGFAIHLDRKMMSLESLEVMASIEMNNL